MKELLRRHDQMWFQLAFTVVIATSVMLIIRTEPIRQAEELTLDTRFSTFPRPDLADTNVVLIAIDNGSLDLLAQNGLNWPWSRDIYAHAIQVLESAKVRAILFDLLFYDSDIDRYEVDPMFSDGAFATRLNQSRITVIGTELLPKMDRTVMLPKSIELDASSIQFEPVVGFEGIRLPYAPFTAQANHIGATNVVPDAGGIIRQTHLAFRYEDVLIPSIAVKTLMAAGEPMSFLNYSSAKQRIYWYGPAGPDGVFRYIPFSALIQAPSGSLDFLNNKIVVIGAFASGLLDFKPTPISKGNAYPGIEIWATVLSNLLNRHFVEPIPVWLEWVTFLILAFLTLQTFRIRYSTVGIALTVLLMLSFIGVGIWVWVHYRLPLPYMGGMITVILSFSANSVLKYLSEGNAKNEIRTIFSRYVHPDVIESLTSNPHQITMGGDMVNATILFTDIADFTTYAEKKRADVLVKELNEYLSVLTETVLNDGGLLDKFTGDGIMALYGVPLPSTNHAILACKTAIWHQTFTRSLNSATASESDIFFHQNTRIGINTGDIIAGNIGSFRRMDFSAIGDDVNLAARLEGVNKVYGTRIIIGENTREQIGERFVVRELDSIQVKGKEKTVRIFELIGEQTTPELITWIHDYEEGLLWYRQGEWSRAKTRFSELAIRNPKDMASTVMAERCDILNELNPSDWNGVFRMKSK